MYQSTFFLSIVSVLAFFGVVLWLHARFQGLDSNLNWLRFGFRLRGYDLFAQSDIIWAPADTWKVLGPFQAGTRETEWGADPLEAFGGFQTLEHDENAKFPSSLCSNGVAKWQHLNLASFGPTKADLTVKYDQVDWDMIRSTYGWSGLQFQAWVRGSFTLPRRNLSESGDKLSTRQLAIYLKNSMEMWVDGTRHHFGGDVYDYRRAPALILELEPGEHRIDVKAINEIRMFGGRQPPKVDIGIYIRILEGSLILNLENAIVPDRVGGRFAGEWIGVPLHNVGGKKLTILSASVSSTDSSKNPEDLKQRSILLLPGQIYLYKLNIGNLSTKFSDDLLHIEVHFREFDDEEMLVAKSSVKFRSHANATLSHLYTYLHPSGTVSRGILRPPPKNICSGKVPILLHLHGAGVDVKSPVAGEAYDDLPDLCAWVVTPSGGTTWCGDDWHRWGLADAEAAVQGINYWIRNVHWSGASVDIQRWFVAGHSNGGQGAWYTISHRHDHVFCATPLSGYLSIMSYVPYNMWHETEPKIQSLLLHAMSTYRTELLVEMIAGSRILQGHGSQDSNVPAFHSRRIFQLLKVQGGNNSDLVSYHEFEGKEHWFPGIMTFEAVGKFVRKCFHGPIRVPPLLNNFEIVVANPADTEAKGGIKVDQLELPNRLGRISVEIQGNNWRLRTSNIRRLHFTSPRIDDMLMPEAVYIDGQPVAQGGSHDGALFYKLNSTWQTTRSSEWRKSERHGKQLGAMDAILDTTEGPFVIACSLSSPAEAQLAVNLNRNLYQYFGTGSEIVDHKDVLSQPHLGNIVFLGIPDPNIFPPQISIPIKVDEGGALIVETKRGERRRYGPAPGLGAIFLTPLSNGKLGLVIWGSDEYGFRRAARLFPLRTGVGQPDFIIIDKATALHGAAGALALGFMDNHWQISEEASYFR